MTTTTWQRHTARSEVIRSVLAREANRSDGSLAWHEVPGVATSFDSPGDLLRTLHLAWLTRLTSRLDAVLERGSDDLASDVLEARDRLAADNPSLARILDRHRDHPDLAVAMRTELRFVAVAAGLASLLDPADVAAARGESLVFPLRSAA